MLRHGTRRVSIRPVLMLMHLSLMSSLSAVAFPVIDEPIFDAVGLKKSDVQFQGGVTSYFYDQQLPGVLLLRTASRTNAEPPKEELNLAVNEISRVSEFVTKLGKSRFTVSNDKHTTKDSSENEESLANREISDRYQLLGYPEDPIKPVTSTHRLSGDSSSRSSSTSSYAGYPRAGSPAKIQPPAINDDGAGLLSAHTITTKNGND